MLEVLGAAARPFLRISAAGVFADVAAEEFFTTSNPIGAATATSYWGSGACVG